VICSPALVGIGCSIPYAIFSSLLRSIYHGLGILTFVIALTDTSSTLAQTRGSAQAYPALEVSHAFLYRLRLASDLADRYFNGFAWFNTFYFVSLNIQLVCHRIQKSKENTDNKLYNVHTLSATYALIITNLDSII